MAADPSVRALTTPFESTLATVEALLAQASVWFSAFHGLITALSFKVLPGTRAKTDLSRLTPVRRILRLFAAKFYKSDRLLEKALRGDIELSRVCSN